ncbi:MAG: nicotinate-nucleotide--dimethylbenzimidazole phosphoribosyltransferase [Deltaproteobacteria bacterium]|nr:nicotinate-nucleotide--dimethylbenzimidazole phosphoribosyltransferase [Deltaproteobacteria bacterium]MBW2020147.1 nicotinate-nucleotide--dimethylbenzimidazole phosphoribosyltransferase [Deltaproteobacteria bacterium]MBW2075062.1 nicotinate-nucleotide--dimethylbenzimidazole phosphoribosyltransferase [Deltaproteobacteria bacterium]
MNLEEIVRSIEPADQRMIEQAREHTSGLVMPPRALGELHVIGERVCGIQRTLEPLVKNKAVLVMAGDHGVAAQGVSAYPQEVTGEMVKTFVRGGAGINVLARQAGARVVVVDMGIIADVSDFSADKTIQEAQTSGENVLVVKKIARGTRDFTRGPAMTREQAEESVMSGYAVAADLFEQGVELLGTGDMGIGNTSPSSAIGAVITGQPVERMTGRGTGVDDDAFARKCQVIQTGIDINRPDPNDPLDVLSKVGGFEIGGIAGAILAAAHFQRPVVVDGLISTAGALLAHAMCPTVADYMFAGHRSVEQGHQHMHKHMGLRPLLDLGMRLGEGTGAALAMHLIEAGVRVFREVLTFEQAEVSKG